MAFKSFEAQEQSLRPLLFVPVIADGFTDNADDLDAESQVQAEFIAAIEQGMVTTRGKEQSLLQTNTLNHDRDGPKSAGKRKKQGGLKKSWEPGLEILTRGATTVNGVAVNGTAQHSHRPEEIKVVIERTNHLKEDQPNEQYDIVFKNQEGEEDRSTKTRSKANSAAPKKPPHDLEVMMASKEAQALKGDSPATPIEIDDLPDDESVEASESSGHKNESTSPALPVPNAAPSGSSMARKIIDKSRGREQELENTGKSTSREYTTVSEQPSETVQPKHKRFDEGEDNMIDAKLAEAETPEEPVEEPASLEESDDDAPEEVTAAAGKAKAKATAASASEATKRQAEDMRAKRRKRDEDLKKQAKASKKRRFAQDEDSDEDSSDISDTLRSKRGARDVANEVARSMLQAGGPLPARLPDEILAVEPEPRSPELPASASKSSSVQISAQVLKIKRKRLDAETKPVKDIKHGNRRLRVLPQESTTLPPPVVHKSAKTREDWLKKGKGKIQVPGYRQKGAKSFLTR